MTIAHHPSDIILAEFANSSLDEAVGLVVGTHIARCPECQKTIRRFEALGWAMLHETTSETSLKIDAEILLLRLESAPIEGDRVPVSVSKPIDGSYGVMSHYEGGEWRWIGPAIHSRTISVPSDKDIRVFMLKARAGTTLPHHKHSGIEWTQVLEGAFVHAHGRFGPGDFDEADSSIEHDPVVEQGSDCICLVAMNGRLELQGGFGRLAQPFVRL